MPAVTPRGFARILVTTDFSPESKRALPCAAAFAERLGGEIALLNVLEPPPRFGGLESVAWPMSGDAAMGRIYRALDGEAELAFSEGLKVETHARTGKPYREIIKAAAELDADLIIMATHGRTGLQSVFVGSTTERVVRHASCPVLAVRGTGKSSAVNAKKAFTLQHVVLATDFSASSLKSLLLGAQIATAFGARITLLHVVERFVVDSIAGEETTRSTSKALMDDARARLNNLAAPLRKTGLKVDTMVEFGSPFFEIARAARELQASLVVVGTRGHTGLKRMYLGSVADRVVRHAPCPVLVTR